MVRWIFLLMLMLVAGCNERQRAVSTASEVKSLPDAWTQVYGDDNQSCLLYNLSQHAIRQESNIKAIANAVNAITSKGDPNGTARAVTDPNS